MPYSEAWAFANPKSHDAAEQIVISRSSKPQCKLLTAKKAKAMPPSR